MVSEMFLLFFVAKLQPQPLGTRNKKNYVEKAFIDLQTRNDWLIIFKLMTDQYLMSQRSHVPEEKTKNVKLHLFRDSSRSKNGNFVLFAFAGSSSHLTKTQFFAFPSMTAKDEEQNKSKSENFTKTEPSRAVWLLLLLLLGNKLLVSLNPHTTFSLCTSFVPPAPRPSRSADERGPAVCFILLLGHKQPSVLQHTSQTRRGDPLRLRQTAGFFFFLLFLWRKLL